MAIYFHPVLNQRFIFTANLQQGRLVHSIGLNDKVKIQKKLNRLNLPEEAWLQCHRGDKAIIAKLQSYIQKNSNRTGGKDSELVIMAIKHYKRLKK